MKFSWRSFLTLPVAMVVHHTPVVAQNPAPDAPPNKTGEIKTKGTPATDPRKAPTKKTKKEREKKSPKEVKEADGFDPKSFLLKLVMNVDDDGDGVLNTTEFRKVPLLKELKKDRVDSLFTEIDANADAALDAEEIGRGYGKIAALAKSQRSILDDKDAAKQAKKLKRLTK